MADMPVTHAGILMDDEPDASGIRWAVSNLEGWDSAPIRADDGDLTGQHGGYGTSRLYAARPLVLSGRAHCPDFATAFRVRDVVCSSMPAVNDSTKLIVHEPVPKWLAVKIGGAPLAGWPLNAFPFRVAFRLSLVAHYPFKRALDPHVIVIPAGQSRSVTNAGTASARVTATTASAGTVRLRQNTSGAVMRSRVSVAAGTMFDGVERTVTSPAGLDIYDAMASPSEWLEIPRESTVTIANQGTAALSLTVYDTYA